MKPNKKKLSLRQAAWQGMNWIRPEKRLAIYLRDGLACCWCGASVEEVKLTLDHLIPVNEGGSNATTNLLTSCHRCNSSRGSRSLAVFAQAIARYLNHGLKPVTIRRHVCASVLRPIDVVEARELIARRGGFTAALKGEES